MSSEFIPTIGLEVHAELKTQTKMFCACKNNPDEERPNWNICPVCMGHPGTLPVINKEAVKHILKVGVAVGGKLADKSEFDRKNYFYPDIPKGYQISQYKYPLVSGGELAGVLLTRIHLEEDTASSSHGESGNSLVNFNRAGVPLLELVTEPVIHSASEVVKFGEELQLLLQYLGVSDANMEKGEMRLEANISVSKKGSPKLGTKVEVKNLNSFRSAERAVMFEINRHIETIENGGEIKQETRGW
ncbi:MAG: Asp-tRNA(Asn)/Glu-tRNA(Gln) amidotransferase subunit GatB, partial [Ignavibacteriaceae bacterium]|nr:Asp-tRNA(Asn)/Glu-tRNA(Gln) amidotransferase subunit GatB [Ignavibacteriaceae bacterium]